MNRAGFPATIALSGTSLVTTEPAPIMALSPIVTLGKMVACAPIHHLSYMNRCMIEILAVIGSEAVIQSRHHHAMPYQCSVADKDTALVLKLATRVDKDILPYVDIFPKSV